MFPLTAQQEAVFQRLTQKARCVSPQVQRTQWLVPDQFLDDLKVEASGRRGALARGTAGSSGGPGMGIAE